MKLLKRLLTFSRSRKPKKLPELLKALRELPASQREKVLTQSLAAADWRLTLQVVAETLKVSEREVVLKLSAMSQIPYLDPVPRPEYASIAAASLNIALLREAGAAPVFKGDSLIAFACVDPIHAEERLRPVPGVTFCFATWFQIAKALDSAAEGKKAQEAERAAVAAREARETALKVLEFILAEVADHGATEFTLVSDKQGSRYEFITNRGVRGEGAIQPAIWLPLAQIVRNGELPAGTAWREESSLAREALRILSKNEIASPEVNDSVVIRFPDRGAAPKEEEARVAPLENAAVTEARVLVVEDDHVFGSILGKFLSRHGLHPIHVRSGEEALTWLSASTNLPDLIISDLNMGGMNGYEVLRHVKEDPRFADIPVIVLTSEDDVDTKLELLSGGAHIFLSKAEDPRVLALEANRLARTSQKFTRGAA